MPTKKKITKKTKLPEKKTKIVASPLENKTSENKPFRMPVLVIGAVVFLAIAALLYYFKGIFVAALVNGQPISRLNVIQRMEDQFGERTLNDLIVKSLVFQEAQKRKITVSEKELDEEIKKIESQVSQGGQKLDDLLAAEGMTKAQLKEQIKVNKIAEQIIGKKADVSDKEIQEFIQNNQQSLPENLQGQELNNMVKDQLRRQKLSREFQAWIEQARKDSKISFFVNY